MDSQTLHKFLRRRVRLHLNASRTVQGRLAGYDVASNVVLEDAVSVDTGEKLGTVMLRGNGVVSMELAPEGDVSSRPP